MPPTEVDNIAADLSAVAEGVDVLIWRISRLEKAVKLIAEHAESPHALADKLRQLMEV